MRWARTEIGARQNCAAANYAKTSDVNTMEMSKKLNALIMIALRFDYT